MKKTDLDEAETLTKEALGWSSSEPVEKIAEALLLVIRGLREHEIGPDKPPFVMEALLASNRELAKKVHKMTPVVEAAVKWKNAESDKDATETGELIKAVREYEYYE